MKFPDIIEVTLKVVKVFEKFNIPYHIGGSLASSAFGMGRSTLDVDIVADIRPEQAPLLAESLGLKKILLINKLFPDDFRNLYLRRSQVHYFFHTRGYYSS